MCLSSVLVDLVQAIMMLLDQKLSERKKRATSMEWQYRVLEAMGTMTGPSTGSTARVVTISSPYTRLTAVNLSTRDFSLPVDVWGKIWNENINIAFQAITCILFKYLWSLVSYNHLILNQNGSFRMSQ